MIEDCTGFDTPQKQSTTTTAADLHAGKDIDEVMDMIQNAMKNGRVSRLSTSDLLSATTLLQSVIPDGMRLRAEKRSKKGDCYLKEDPVHIHLWSLTMKLREGPQHAEEVLKLDILNRILSVMEATDPKKYKAVAESYMTVPDPSAPAESATHDEILLAKELCSSQGDLVCCTAVLHELIRYRSGCVALAENQKCLDFLLREIPTPQIIILISNLSMKDFGERSPQDNNANWASWLTYQPGMIEQGTIDTIGRLFNGLDEHPQLRKKVAKELKREFVSLEKKVETVLVPLNPLGTIDKMLIHRLDLKRSMKKLCNLVAEILNKTNNKKLSSRAWSSTFLLDRKYINDPNTIFGQDDKLSNKRACHTCGKKPERKLQMCGKCKTVFYCSRECQVKDWKTHKKECVKHRGYVPSDKSSHTGHLNQMLEKLAAADMNSKSK